MRGRLIAGTLITGLALALSGCFGSQAQYGRDEAVAKVNNQVITKAYFDKKLQAIKSLLKDTQQGKENLDSFEVKKGLLEQLVRTELLAQEARRIGLDKEKDTQETLQAIERDLLAQAMYTKLLRDVAVTPEEIEKFYNDNKEYLKEPVEIKVREMVAKTQAEAKDLLVKVMQGENFAAVAQQYSIADSAKKGGDLGYLSTADKELGKKEFPKFLNVAFSTEKGELSQIFKGPDESYYIIKVEDKRGGELKTLGQLEDQIKKYLQTTKENKIVDEEIRRITAKAKIEKNEDLLK